MSNVLSRIAKLGVALSFISASLCVNASPTADELVKKIDANYEMVGRIATITMIVNSARGPREIISKMWLRGDDAFVEYISPAREQGTKMLKRGNKLWIYKPSADRVINIAGHLLRQSLMGSDSSYEDFMSDDILSRIYDSEITGEGELDGRPVYLVTLTAKEGKSPAYYSRKIQIDKERFLPLREDMFAKSGKLIKRVSIDRVLRDKGRWFPKEITFNDVLKSGDGTSVVIESGKFDVDIPNKVFSKASLRR